MIACPNHLRHPVPRIILIGESAVDRSVTRFTQLHLLQNILDPVIVGVVFQGVFVDDGSAQLYPFQKIASERTTLSEAINITSFQISLSST